jgi:hypothetical protein
VLDQRGVTFFDALQAFFQEHQYCGELDGGVEAESPLDDLHVRGGNQSRAGAWRRCLTILAACSLSRWRRRV